MDGDAAVAGVDRGRRRRQRIRGRAALQLVAAVQDTTKIKGIQKKR